jgi:hypothetical protein
MKFIVLIIAGVTAATAQAKCAASGAEAQSLFSSVFHTDEVHRAVQVSGGLTLDVNTSGKSVQITAHQSIVTVGPFATRICQSGNGLSLAILSGIYKGKTLMMRPGAGPRMINVSGPSLDGEKAFVVK